jgi:hypothetical protein
MKLRTSVSLSSIALVAAIVGLVFSRPMLANNLVQDAGVVLSRTPVSNDDSLIRAICYRRAFIKGHPGSEAIVALKTWPNGQITALPLYVSAGKVLVSDRFDDHGRVVTGLSASDLYHQTVVQLALSKNLIDATAIAPVSESEQLVNDLTALQTAGIPAALHTEDDGRALLAFEWDNLHYTFTKADGCRLSAVAVDPVTNRPYLCLNRGDIFEVAVFIADYRRLYPTEKAFAVFSRPLMKPFDPILPCAVYTKKNSLFIFSPILGHVQLSALTLTDIHDTNVLISAYHALLQTFMREHGVLKFGDLLNAPRVIPDSLAGDNAELQDQRALNRVQDVGILTQLKSNDPATNGVPYLVLSIDGLQYVWSYEGRTSWYAGRGSRLMADSVINALIFVRNYLYAHPSEKAYAYIHPLPDSPIPNRLVATCVYTKAGKVFSHHQHTGDLLSTLTPADITDRAKVISVTNKIFQAARAIQVSKEALISPMTPHFFDTASLQPKAIAQQFKACGIQNAVIPNVIKTEAGESLSVGSNLVFDWDGKSYIYSKERGCFPSPIKTFSALRGLASVQ